VKTPAGIWWCKSENAEGKTTSKPEEAANNFASKISELSNMSYITRIPVSFSNF